MGFSGKSASSVMNDAPARLAAKNGSFYLGGSISSAFQIKPTDSSTRVLNHKWPQDMSNLETWMNITCGPDTDQ